MASQARAPAFPDPDPRPAVPARILVLGLGNDLLSDEAVGIRVVRYLAETLPNEGDVQILDGGTLSFTLAGPIAEASGLIVVDAARLGSAPGTVAIFEGEAMDRKLNGTCSSVHEVGLADLFDIARLTDSLPPHRCLVGIEPAEIDWGSELSEAVARSVPEAAARIRTLIDAWRRERRD